MQIRLLLLVMDFMHKSTFMIILFICLMNNRVNTESSECDLIRPKRNYPLALILLPKNFTTFPWALTIPSIEIGLEKVRNMTNINPIIKDIKILPPRDSACSDSSIALYACVQAFVKELPDVVFGPICDYAMAPVARLMSLWNRPIITSGALYYAFSQDRQTEFKTLTRMGSGHLDKSTGHLISKIFEKYKWKRARYIYFKEAYDNIFPMYCHALGSYIIRNAPKFIADWPIRAYSDITDIRNDTALGNLLIEQVGNNYAIIVLCADPDIVRRIMLKAADLNFITGEYLFINIDIFSSDDKMRKPWYRQGRPKKENDKARKAFRFLMTITLNRPGGEKYKEFSQEVKRRAEKNYNYHFNKEMVNNFVSSLHDSVILYALALNETLSQGGTIENGSLVVKNMWNRSFQGIEALVTISADGDRFTDFSLLDLNQESGDFEVVANYIGSKNQYVHVFNKSIDWGLENNQIPLDKPKCGYNLFGCPKPNKTINIGAISAGIMGTFVAIFIVVGVYKHRQTKFQAELKAMNWIIPWDALETTGKRRQRQYDDDINKFVGNKDQISIKILAEKKTKAFREGDSMENDYLMTDLESSRKKKHKPNKIYREIIFNDREDKEEGESNGSLDTIVGINLENMHNMQLYIKTAMYKGNLVALKPMNIYKKIECNTNLLIEVKKVKDMSNEHICRFIGACLDLNNQYLVYEYCPKGSLEDVLAKDQIKLDWMFKYSLMQDICRGMVYLHNNHGSHGNLKSSNCLVDSRFVLKITDFGLHSLRGNRNVLEQEETNIYYKNLLWTSPELLRLSNPPSNGTVKADVYSFAIICQEIVYRNGVFFLDNNSTLSAQEIIEKVCKNSCTTFRPALFLTEGCTDDLLKLIQQAWDEDPSSRPEFATIKQQIRKLNKGGDTGNLLDNLLSRMEQYATNLEGLVTQRTEQYLEEKQKAEDLLYSMLPKSVAHQLIKNKVVNAENYESVTIYFSDIVGFTSLSAESTAIQIIQLLNRLYTTFDSIIEDYDVYKVETIGDAYMVCSGLPQLNGNLHAREIGRMAIAFLTEIKIFIIPHRPEKKLELRIGIHSGPVCSGVVGSKMPRYCLFGDTVNTSSRMESNGLPLKIHISQSTKDILDTFGTFIISERGYVDMKGKGSQLTYWLHGEGSNIVDSPSDVIANDHAE